MMAGRREQRLVELGNGVRLIVTDHGLDYGNRFTADVYSADGKCCGSLGSESDFGRGFGEYFAAEYDKCVLKALSATAGK
jgi:hypothetical protein